MTKPSPSTDIRTTKTIRLRTAPSWLPEKFRQRVERIRVSFKPSVGERRFFKQRKIEPPSVWAPKSRTVTYGPLSGSRWDNSFMPHMRGIMDASFFPTVRYIGNCKAPQSGSSAGMETMLGYIADLQPGPVLITYPDRDTASKRSTDYLQPMFQKSPRLRTLLTGSADDMASLRINLQTMLIYMGWAGSVTSLGNVSARYLVGEECDKWPVQAAKKEASTHKLFTERFRSYKYGGKCWWISTPTGPDGFIWQYMTKEAQVIFDYHVPCPECGEVHRMAFDYIKFGDERDPKKIEEGDIARYVFPCCGLVADDRLRIKALQQGHWRERITGEDGSIASGRELFDCLRQSKPRKICFHSPAWISPLVSHAEIAAAFLRGLKDPAAMHYYDNQIAAVAHTPYRQHRKQDVIRVLKDDRPAGLVPGGGRVAALVAGVDTQKGSFVFVIRAFGPGIKQPSWKIREGEVDSFAALEQVLFDDHYRDAAGLYYPVHLAVMDTGGGKGAEEGTSRTVEVYDFARLHPSRIMAYKGASGRKPKPRNKTIIDTYPGSSVPIPGGVELWVCDSHHYKDYLAGKLRVKGDDPGAFLLDGDTSEQYINEMCAEYLNERRMWVCPAGKPNHFWDCETMALIGADQLGLRYLPDAEAPEENEQGEE